MREEYRQQIVKVWKGDNGIWNGWSSMITYDMPHRSVYLSNITSGINLTTIKTKHSNKMYGNDSEMHIFI